MNNLLLKTSHLKHAFTPKINLSNIRWNSNAPGPVEPARLEKTLNAVQLVGRVGADPQKKGSEAHPVAVFSLATHTNYRYESGEFLQRTEWHRIICFKPGLRETILNYLKKGQRVHVTGRLTYGEIKGDDGKQKTTTAIAADDVIFFAFIKSDDASKPDE